MGIDKGKSDGARKAARHAAALRPKSREPKECPEVKTRIVRLIRGGCTLTEICQRRDMPSYSTLCEWRTYDELFAADVAEAMSFQCEYVIKESADMVRAEAEKDIPDTDKQKVLSAWAEVSMKYAAALAPRKFGALSIKLGGDGWRAGVGGTTREKHHRWASNTGIFKRSWQHAEGPGQRKQWRNSTQT